MMESEVVTGLRHKVKVRVEHDDDYADENEVDEQVHWGFGTFACHSDGLYVEREVEPREHVREPRDGETQETQAAGSEPAADHVHEASHVRCREKHVH